MPHATRCDCRVSRCRVMCSRPCAWSRARSAVRSRRPSPMRCVHGWQLSNRQRVVIPDAVSLGCGPSIHRSKHKPRPDHPSGANRERPVRSGRRRPHAGQHTRCVTLCNGKDLLATDCHVALHHASAVSATTSAPPRHLLRGRCRFWRCCRGSVIDGHEGAHAALAPRDSPRSTLRRLDAVIWQPRAEPAGERAELRPRQLEQLLPVDARGPQRHGRASSRAIASRVFGPTTPSTTRPCLL